MLVLVVARERGVLVHLLAVLEDLEDPAGLGIGLLRREPSQAQLRVGGSALGHEAAHDARNQLELGGVELGKRLAGRLLLGGLLRMPLSATELLAVTRPRGVREDRLRQLRREPVDQLREVGVRGYWCEDT